MSQFHMNGVQHYSDANQLQGNVGTYRLMFDALLRLNGEGQKAYLRHDFENENQVFEKCSRILIGMRALFLPKRTKTETLMFDYFSMLLDQTLNFSEYDDRTNYYVNLYASINELYKFWKPE